MMNDTRVMSMEELQAFLNSSGGLKFNGYSRTETYAWIEKTLRQYHYLARPRAQKGLLRQYLRKVSGYSPAQLTRLIDQFHCTTHLCVCPYKRHRFPTKFTRISFFCWSKWMKYTSVSLARPPRRSSSGNMSCSVMSSSNG